ncbi:unnamed protein product, partial [Mycena citricolor]
GAGSQGPSSHGCHGSFFFTDIARTRSTAGISDL